LYDKLVYDSFMNNSIDEILKIEEVMIENTKPDSFWPILILIEILKVKKFIVEDVMYTCPTYFGMMAVKFKKI